LADLKSDILGIVVENFKIFFIDPTELFTQNINLEDENYYSIAPTGIGSIITSFAIQEPFTTYNKKTWKIAIGTAESRCNFSVVEKITNSFKFTVSTQVTFKCEKLDTENSNKSSQPQIQIYYPVTQLLFNP
jgi:hypothetical protein